MNIQEEEYRPPRRRAKGAEAANRTAQQNGPVADACGATVSQRRVPAERTRAASRARPTRSRRREPACPPSAPRTKTHVKKGARGAPDHRFFARSSNLRTR